MLSERFLVGKFMFGLIPTEAPMYTRQTCTFCEQKGLVLDREGTLTPCPVCRGKETEWSCLQLKERRMKILRVDTMVDTNGGSVRLTTSQGTFDSRQLFPTKEKARSAAYMAAEAYNEGRSWTQFTLRPITQSLTAP